MQEREAALKRLDEALQLGLDDIEAGRVYPAEQVFAELRAKYRAMADKES